MRILAIDTTGPAASAAVYCNGQVHQAYLEDGHTHSQKIQALIEQAMQEAGLLPNMLTGIAVTNGPGSFTEFASVSPWQRRWRKLCRCLCLVSVRYRC